MKIDFTLLNKHKKKILNAALIFFLLYGASSVAFPAAKTVFMTVKASPRKLPIYSVATEEKKVAISFDAAWGSDDTDDILRILAGNDVKATFFLCGYWVTKYPDEVKMIYEAGHDIGNHGDTHAHGAKLDLEQNKKEINGVHKKVFDLLGIEINLFRPPYGEYNDTVLDAAKSLGYYTIQWDIDTLGIKIEVTRIL